MSDLSIKFKCRKEDFVGAVEMHCRIKNILIDNSDDLVGAVLALLQAIGCSNCYVEVDEEGCRVLDNEEGLVIKFVAENSDTDMESKKFTDAVEKIQKAIEKGNN